MEYFLVAMVAFLVSPLTLYSGFGLGTLLMPVFAFFFPVPVAVAATAVVHGANNAFKTALLGRSAERSLVLRFGLPAIPSAFFGCGSSELAGRDSRDHKLFPWGNPGGDHAHQAADGGIDRGVCSFRTVCPHCGRFALTESI